MTLWPRTLLWRSVLLIALVLVVAHAAWWQIFRVSERGPRARQVAQQIVSVVNLTRAALVTAQPSKRYDLLAQLSQQEGIQVYAGEPGERIAALPDRAFLEVIATDLRNRLGADTRMALSRNGISGLWVSFRIDGDEYWVLQPRSRIERNEPLVWVVLGVLVLALALTGAVLIVARVNQPLRELTRAAAEMGQGNVPAPVSETGPAEIRTLARAFNQMAADLKRLDEERALLLAGVSHDLRTPLARIRLGLEMLEDKGDAIKTDIVQDIEDIDAAISQFLDFARVADTQSAMTPGDLNALVRSVVERRERPGQRITTQLAPLPALPLRPLAIQRLIANLIDNSLRHSDTAVEVRTAVEGERAVVEVLDRGPGIPPDQTQRMLQPFTRLEGARTGPGTGLGLAIVDRIARMHGGSVQLLPRDGGGLRARVELPLDARSTP